MERQQRFATSSSSNGLCLWTTLADSAGATYTLGVVPGVYDLVYEHHQYYPVPSGSARAPFNGGATLRQGVSIQGAPGSAATLNVDVPVTTISGNITVNGATCRKCRPLMLFGSERARGRVAQRLSG